MKKIVISIPVHEQPQVVKNHLENIHKFVPNSSVILHASGDNPNFRNEIASVCNSFDGFAYLNDISFPTHSPNDAGFVTNLSSVHAKNFEYISKIIDFDLFAMETSNDMFVRRGVEQLFDKYKCGCFVMQNNVDNIYNDNINFRPFIDKMRSVLKLKTFEKCSQEGTWYPREVFKEVSDIILNKIGGLLAAEEIILHTLAFNLFPELYDNNLGDTYVFHKWQDYATKNEDIIDVCNGKYENKYVVKRVPRNIDDPCRKFVNKLTENI